MQLYREEFGVDVSGLPGAGAAGGLAGGLAALGGDLVPGFGLLVDELDLTERVAEADLVITGEGFLDEQSFEGKVVGSVAALAAAAGKRVVAIAGDVYDDAAERIEAVSLVERFGEQRALEDTLACIEAVVTDLLA